MGRREAQRGADGIVVITYPGRIRRFQGGIVTHQEGRIIHLFQDPGTFKPRWPWRLWTCSVEYLIQGGGGGGADSSPGKPGDTLTGTITPTGPLKAVIGRGGAPGFTGQAGGESRLT